MRSLVLLGLLACTDKPYELDTSEPEDTGLGVCGKVRGTTGILMYAEDDDGLTVKPPLDTPNDTQVTTGVAGPVDDVSFLAVTDGDVIRSDDKGCNWTAVGALPDGDWGLVQAGSSVYAFDRGSSAGARTDDLGLNWTAFDTGGVFLGLPTVDATNPMRVRGVQARGVVTTDDGGATWPVSGSLPTAEYPATGSSASTGNLDLLLLAGPGGIYRTVNGGSSWELVFYNQGDAYTVAIHPDDGDIAFAFARDEAGTLAAWHFEGHTWTMLATETQIEIVQGLDLYPVPGDTRTVVAGHGPVLNDDDERSLALYQMTAGEGTDLTRVTMYYHLHQLAFGDDRWVAAVDSQLER
jgi:hypothetical protein